MNYGVWRKPEEDAWHAIYCWGEIKDKPYPQCYRLVKRFDRAVDASNYCMRLNDEYRRKRLTGESVNE